MKISKKLLVLASVFATAALAGCGGKEVRTSGSGNSGLGQEQVNAQESNVTTSRQVTRTITSQTEIPSVRTTVVRGNLNRMQPSHFQVLGLRADLAKKVVEHRDDKGPFRSVDELRQVDGMDEGQFNAIKDKVAAGPTD